MGPPDPLRSTCRPDRVGTRSPRLEIPVDTASVILLAVVAFGVVLAVLGLYVLGAGLVLGPIALVAGGHVADRRERPRRR